MDSSSTTVLKKEWLEKSREVSVRRKVRSSGTSMHMHDYFEIEIIVGGEGDQNLNGEMCALRRGCAYILSPVDFHRLFVSKKLELINIEFGNNTISKRLLNILINRHTNTLFELNEESLAQVEFLVSMLEKDGGEEDGLSELNKKNLLECLLIFLLRHTGHSYSPEDEELIDPIYKCMRYLFLHFDEAPSLEEMARISGYSASYFSKQFHDITGKKYIDFLTSLRLNHAKLLIIGTKKSILEICEACGFSSVSNFNHVFKKSLGMSPTQYRRMKK